MRFFAGKAGKVFKRNFRGSEKSFKFLIIRINTPSGIKPVVVSERTEMNAAPGSIYHAYSLKSPMRLRKNGKPVQNFIRRRNRQESQDAFII